MGIDYAIEDVVRDAGIEVVKKGKTLMAQCPFHDDKRPSMALYVDSQRFICFGIGCGERGDAVDFIMKLKGVSFKEAKKLLNGNGTRNFTVTRKPRDPKAEMFKQWKKEYLDKVCLLLRGIRRMLALKHIKGRWKMERAHLLFHALPILEYHYEVFTSSSAEDLEMQEALYANPDWQI